MYNFFKKKGITLIILSVSFYIILGLYSDFGNLIKIFQHVNLVYLPIILSIVIFSIFLKSERQRFLLKTFSSNIPIKDSFLIFNAGQSLLVTPIGIGNLIKSQFFKQKFNIVYSKSLPLILIEKYYDLLGILSIVILFLIIRFDFTLFFPIAIISIILFITTLIIKNKFIFTKTVFLFKKFPKLNKFSEGLFESHASLLSLTSKKNFSIIWPFSMICWMADAVAVYFCFLSFDLSFDILNSTLISFISLILGTLSFLPGGLGVTETSFIGFLLKYGVDISVATALIMYIRLNTIWFSTFLGLLSMKIFSIRNNTK